MSAALPVPGCMHLLLSMRRSVLLSRALVVSRSAHPVETVVARQADHSMFLYRWVTESGSLAMPEPGSMTSLLPIVHFQPQQCAESASTAEYQCPLYQTSARSGMLSSTGQSTNFVLHICLPIPRNSNAADWILQGAAAVCSTNL